MLPRHPRIDLRQLRYFISVAECGSVSGAAKVLNMSQPPLSKTMQDLEAELGVTLYDRSVRGITLTDAGLRLQAEARSILSHTADACHSVQRIGRGEIGELRIGVLGWLLWGGFADIINKYRLDNPDLHCTVHDYSPAAQTTMLHDGRLDVGINRLITWKDFDKKFKSVVLRTDELFAVVPSTHSLAKFSSVTLHDLQELDLIMMTEDVSDLAEEILKAHHRAGITPNINQCAIELHTVLALVASGSGYSIFPDTLARISWPGINFIPVVGDLPKLELRVSCRNEGSSSSAHRFISYLESQNKITKPRII